MPQNYRYQSSTQPIACLGVFRCNRVLVAATVDETVFAPEAKSSALPVSGGYDFCADTGLAEPKTLEAFAALVSHMKLVVDQAGGRFDERQVSPNGPCLGDTDEARRHNLLLVRW